MAMLSVLKLGQREQRRREEEEERRVWDVKQEELELELEPEALFLEEVRP